MKQLLLSAFVLVAVSIIPGSDQQCTPDFKSSFLAKANQLRQRHGVGPLTLDSGSLQAWAQTGADLIAKENKFSNRPSNPYGENQGIYHGIYPSGELVVKNWYDAGAGVYVWYGGEPDYRYFNQIGSFTQLIWRTTTKVAVGCVKTDGGYYVVATFDPIGNRPNLFYCNVLRGSADTLSAEGSGGGNKGPASNPGIPSAAAAAKNTQPSFKNNNKPQQQKPQQKPNNSNRPNSNPSKPAQLHNSPPEAGAYTLQIGPNSNPNQKQQNASPGRVTPDPPSPPRVARSVEDVHLQGDGCNEKVNLGSMLRPSGGALGAGSGLHSTDQLVPLGQNVVSPQGSYD